MIAEAITALFRGAATTIDPVHPRDPALARLLGLGSSTSSGVNVTSDKVQAIPAVRRGVNIIANGMMKLPFYVFSESEEGHTWDRSHPSWTCVSRKAHPEITDGVFRQSMTDWAMIWGNAYAKIDRPNWPSGPVSLIPLLPDRTRPFRMNGGQASTEVDDEMDGELMYHTIIGGQGFNFERSEILHIHGPGPNAYLGWNIVELLKETFGGAIATQQFRNLFYGQGATPSGFIEMEGQLGEEAEERFMKSVAKAITGLGKAHKVAVLEEGMKFKQATTDADKQQLVEGQQLDIRMLAMAIGIKVHKLIDSANSSYNSLEQANQEHKDDDLMPWICRWREEMEDKLLTEQQKDTGSHSIDVDDEMLEWVPFRERVEGTRLMFDSGLVDREEGRRKLNFGPTGDPNSKRFRKPANIGFEDEPDSSTPGPFESGGGGAETSTDASNARELSEMIQKIYLGVDVVVTDQEARDILNSSGLVSLPPNVKVQRKFPTVDDGSKPPPEDDDENEEAREIARAYLAKIAKRLVGEANRKAKRGAKAFIEWLDALQPESGPGSIQPAIDDLYSKAKAACDDATNHATSDAELVSLVAELSTNFDAFAEEALNHERAT